MEVTREDAGIYQCLVDNGGSPITQEQKVAIIGMTMMLKETIRMLTTIAF